MMYPSSQRFSYRGRRPSPNGEEDRLTPKKVFTALASLPRVLRLVWRISPILTVLLGVLYIVQGFLPAATAFIAGTLVDAVLRAIQFRGANGTTTAVIWLVVAQFSIQGQGDRCPRIDIAIKNFVLHYYGNPVIILVIFIKR